MLAVAGDEDRLIVDLRHRNVKRARIVKGVVGPEATSLSLVKGENTVLFSNVAGDVNNQSIIVNATNGVVVAGVTFQNNYLPAEELSPAAQATN